MEEIKKNKILLAVLVVTFVNLLIFGFGKIIINKVSDDVIKKLQKDYSPSPYGPGFDPDKVGPQTLNLKHGRLADQLVSYDEYSNQESVWRFNWELERGFIQ